jgi:hypothetical protein
MAMKASLAPRSIGLATAALLLLAIVPAAGRAQQPPFEGALAPDPEKAREVLAQPNLVESEEVLFGVYRAAALIVAPLVEFGVRQRLLGGGAGTVAGPKIRPGSLGSNSGAALAVGYVLYADPYWAGATAGLSTKGYMEHSAFIGLRNLRGSNYLRVTGAYDLDTEDEFPGVPDLDAEDEFPGLGMNSPEDRETDYRQEEWRVLGDGQLSPARTLRFGARGGYRRNVLLEGKNDDIADTESVYSGRRIPGVGLLPGLGEDGKYVQGGGFLAFDSRNDANNPDKGAVIAAAFDAFRGVSDTPFDWNRIAGEFAGYLPLYDERRVIAVRLLAVHQEPLHDQELVPFYYLSSLGGSSFLRSFSSFRFQDNDMIYGAAEFRRRVWAERTGEASLDASLFIESARVGRRLPRHHQRHRAGRHGAVLWNRAQAARSQ